MNRLPRTAGALLVLLAAFGVFGQRTEAQGTPVVSAYRKDRTLNLSISFQGGSPDSSDIVLSRCTVLPSGKVFSDSKVKIRRSGASAEFRWKTNALSPANVEIRAGDRISLVFEVDGRPLAPVTVSVAEAPVAVAVERPPSPEPRATAVTAPAVVAVAAPTVAPTVAPTAAPEPVAAPTVPVVAQADPSSTGVVVPPPVLGRVGTVAESSTGRPTPTPARVSAVLPTSTGAEAPASSEGLPTPPSDEIAAVATPVPQVPEGAGTGAGQGEAEAESPEWVRYAPWVGGGAGVVVVTLIGFVLLRGRSKPTATPTPTANRRAVAAAGGLGLVGSNANNTPIPAAVREAEEGHARLAEAERIGIHVESLIARGGLCDIFLARRGSDRRRCALKVLRPEFRSSTNLSEGLVREGEIIRELNAAYPGQVFITLFDQGFFHDSGTDHPYLVLEYVEGPNLRNYVRQRGALETFAALSAMRALADGLARVHECGFVHGDISPENVLWVSNSSLRRDSEPRFRLIDFGDSRKFDLDVKAEEIAGKPAFLSPEQTTGAAATPASDMYSLGMVLYFLLAGTPAFHSDNALDILKMHRENSLRFPSTFPAEIIAAVESLCEKDPDLRPSAGETVDILDGLLSGMRGVE